jgi:Uma2 family endonuclease
MFSTASSQSASVPHKAALPGGCPDFSDDAGLLGAAALLAAALGGEDGLADAAPATACPRPVIATRGKPSPSSARLKTSLATRRRWRLFSSRMFAVESKSSAAGSFPSRPLPLENGDSLHSREFLRRYERMPWVKKAGLIEGVVYLGSQVTACHAKADALIQAWLGIYASRHPETEALPNAPVILDAENTVQPDALLHRLPEHDGLTRVNDDGYLTGPPELVVEVAASSASIDLRDKRRTYCRNGVREYLVWLLAEARLEWFCLEEDDYRPQLPDAEGVLHSRFFPGLRLPVAALLAGDTARVLDALTEHEPPETTVKSEALSKPRSGAGAPPAKVLRASTPAEPNCNRGGCRTKTAGAAAPLRHSSAGASLDRNGSFERSPSEYPFMSQPQPGLHRGVSGQHFPVGS